MVLHSDTARDLALIRTDALPEGTKALTLADRQVWPGERVHTVAGWPKSSQSLWIYGTGTVRQVSRRTLANGVKTTVMESDALINQGNSGGPVVDDAGEVVAVVEGFATDARGMSLFVGLDAVRGYLDEALPLVDPVTAEDHLKLAYSHQSAFRLDRAIAVMNEAVRLDPDNAGYVAVRGLMFAFNGDFDTARADLDESVEMAPNDSLVQGTYGQYLTLTGEHAEAAEALTRAIRNAPNNADYYALRGGSHRETGELAQAERDLTRAIHLAPQNPGYHMARGSVRRDAGNLSGALDDHQAAVELNPRAAQGWDEIGLDLYADEQYAKAADFHRKAVDRDERNGLYRFHLGDALQEANDYRGGLEALKQAVDLMPQHAPSWHYAGISFAQLDEAEAAEGAYRKAIALDPAYAGPHQSLAGLLRQLGREAEARQEFAAAEQLNANFGDPQAGGDTAAARPTGGNAEANGGGGGNGGGNAGPRRMASIADLAGTWRASMTVDGVRVLLTARVERSGKYVTRYEMSADGQTQTQTETGQMYLDNGQLLIGTPPQPFTRHDVSYTGDGFTVTYDPADVPGGRLTWTRVN